MEEHAHHIEHPDMYDAESSKVGMWLFIFTELLLFGGLFIVYSVPAGMLCRYLASGKMGNRRRHGGFE